MVRYPSDPEFFGPHVGYGESVFHLGDSLTLASLETDSKTGNCPWRVYLGGSSQEVYLEGSKGCSTGWVEKLAWNMVTSELSQTGVKELLVRLGSLNIQSLASVHLLVPGNSLWQRVSQCRGTAVTFLAAGDECIGRGAPKCLSQGEAS